MPEGPQRILVVTAHPDDADFICGGSVARWVKEGREVVYVLATSGDKGSNDRLMTSLELPTIREREQLEAAKVLGLKDVVFLRQPDGGVEDTSEFRGQLVRQIRLHKPDLVVTFDTRGGLVGRHRDHRMVGLVTLDAVYPYARGRLFYPEHIAEGLDAHTVPEVYLFATDKPDIEIDITEHWEQKMAAGRCHLSQIGPVEEFERRRRQQMESEEGPRRPTERFRRMTVFF